MKKKISLFAVLAWTLVTTSAGAETSDPGAFSMKIMDAFAITGRGTVMTGRIDTGSIQTGDTVCVPLASGETVASEVSGIELFRKMLDNAEAGQNVGILVTGINRKAIKKGAILHANCELDATDE
jgi:translation elongation factor EF-Tu-like GTPase